MLKLIQGLTLPLFATGCIGCPSAPPVKPTDAPAMDNACVDEDADLENCRVEKLGPMSLGWLVGGIPMSAVVERLGPADEVGERVFEEATGDTVEDHTWRSKGVVIQARVAEGGSLVVDDFSVEPPFAEVTARGVGLGSTEAEVVKAYGAVADPHFTTPGERLVAGSVYGGIFFYFQNGKVTSIFVGAGAE